MCTLALVAEENRRRVLQRAAACAGRALRFVTKKVSGAVRWWRRIRVLAVLCGWR